MCKKIKLKRDGWFPSEWITSKFSLIIKFIFFQIHYINSNYILDPVFYYITTVYNKSLCSSGIYVWKVDNTGSKIVIQVLLAFFFNRLKIHKLSSSKLYHQSYIHGIFQERRVIPACLFFLPTFYPLMVKVVDGREAQLLLIGTAWEAPIPIKSSKFLFTGYLGRAHSICMKQDTPSYFLSAQEGQQSPTEPFTSFAFFVFSPTSLYLACLSVTWDCQMVSQDSARQIQYCLISKKIEIKPMWPI